MSVLQPKDVDISKITFGEIKKTPGTGQRWVPLQYDGRPSLKIQAPESYSPYGMNVYTEDKGDTYSLSLSFGQFESNPKLKNWFDLLQNLDKRVLEEVEANSKSWIRKDKDKVENYHTKSIKYSIDKDTNEVSTKWPPTFKCKIPVDDTTKKISTLFFDNKHNEIDPLATIPKMKGSQVTAIVAITGIWIGNNFGISFSGKQLLVKTKQDDLAKFAFAELSDGEDDEEDDIVQVKDEVDSSDSEEEDLPKIQEVSDSEEEDEEIAPPVVKKTIRKKAPK